MRAPLAAIVLIATGCGNDAADTDSDAVGSCDTYELAPLPQIDSTAWPAGLAEAVEAYKNLDGIFYVDDCVDDSVEHELKVTTVSQDQIQVITGGVSTGVECGCTLDQQYPHDNAMSPVALLPTIELFVPDSLEPSGVGRTYELEGALFGAGQDLQLRACAHRTIDPAEESDYDDVYVFLRVDDTGAMDMTLMLATLNANAAPSECHFSELRPQ